MCDALPQSRAVFRNVCRYDREEDGCKKFHEQFGKFLERAIHMDSTNQTKDLEFVRLSKSKSGDELNRLKGAQCASAETTVLEKRSRGTRVGRMTAD